MCVCLCILFLFTAFGLCKLSRNQLFANEVIIIIIQSPTVLLVGLFLKLITTMGKEIHFAIHERVTGHMVRMFLGLAI